MRHCLPVSLARAVLALSLFAAVLAPSSPPASPQADSSYGSIPIFEFHSGFWLNLHHTLYHEARNQRDAAPPQPNPPARSGKPALRSSPDPESSFTPSERQAWNDAVAYYAANFADKDLLFTNELIDLKNLLGEFEDCADLSGTRQKFCNAGLDPQLTRVLEAAAPVYRAHFWSDHDRANRRWILRVSPLVREQGLGISQRLADIYETPWPKRRIRVDVSAYANWAGAYTTVDPLRVTISSLDPRNQGDAALEILFHEASHGIAQPVEAAIIRECRQRDKAIPRDLWHALVFYTTGEVIRPILASDGAAQGQTPLGSDAYTPYAFREGLYQRKWEQYLDLLKRFWQPYLDGKVTFDDAIAHIVSAL